MLLDDVAEFFECNTWFGVSYTQIEGLSGCFNEFDKIWVRASLLAYVVCLVQICVIALKPERHVQVDDVAVYERSLIWNAMTNHLIDGGAEGLREVVVIER